MSSCSCAASDGHCHDSNTCVDGCACMCANTPGSCDCTCAGDPIESTYIGEKLSLDHPVAVNFQNVELQKIVALIHRLLGIEIEVPTELTRERITMDSKETTTREIISLIEKEKRCKLSVR